MGLRIVAGRRTIAAAAGLCALATLTLGARGRPNLRRRHLPATRYPRLIVPGNPGKPFFMQDFSQEFVPYTPPAQTDARGVFVATNANSGQTVVGMPGSRLGVVSPRIGPYAGSPGFQTQGFGPGVMIGSMGEPAAEVDPYGHRPPSSHPRRRAVALRDHRQHGHVTGERRRGGRHHGQPPDWRIRTANPLPPGPTGLPVLPPPQPNP